MNGQKNLKKHMFKGYGGQKFLNVAEISEESSQDPKS